jgi:hypothetical protein
VPDDVCSQHRGHKRGTGWRLWMSMEVRLSSFVCAGLGCLGISAWMCLVSTEYVCMEPGPKVWPEGAWCSSACHRYLKSWSHDLTLGEGVRGRVRWRADQEELQYLRMYRGRDTRGGARGRCHHGGIWYHGQGRGYGHNFKQDRLSTQTLINHKSPLQIHGVTREEIK